MAPACSPAGWVGAWAGVPTDASLGTDIGDIFAPSAEKTPGDTKQPVNNASVRAILTPSIGGSDVRIHLSNRFGQVPVTFVHTTIGRQASGAALTGPPTLVTFGGKPSVTVPPGQDGVSDPVPFSFSAFDNLAVSTYVSGDVGKPTEHYEARQTSYFTINGAGDHAGDQVGDGFSLHNSTRPLVTGLDVRVTQPTGAVVTFGDSLTDGYQGQAPAGIPESPEGLDANGRWPDVLGRRLRAPRLPLSTVNVGISGNRVLHDGVDGGENKDLYGPAALKRLDSDVLGQAGATTVIWLEGINDLGQKPSSTTQQVIDGYKQGIARMHAAGLRVLMGTLTPSGGNTAENYGTADTEAMRQQINAWIRANSIADGYIDFDAAVRDPSDPTRINPAYDGGDHLHLNLAGYKTMGETVDLTELAMPNCAPVLGSRPGPLGKRTKRLTVHVSRRYLTVAIASTLRVVRQAGKPVPRALVQLGRFRAKTNAKGIARLHVRFTHTGLRNLLVTAQGAAAAAVRIRAGKR